MEIKLLKNTLNYTILTKKRNYCFSIKTIRPKFLLTISADCIYV